jgi:MoaD family protein
MMRTAVGGAPVVEGDGQTVRDVIADLERRYPGLAGSILGGDGGLHRFVNVYVNNEDVRYLGSLETEVAEGDTVSILPAVAGGA